MKKAILFFAGLFFLQIGDMSAQGWVGNGANTMSAYNSSLALSPVSVGIGTNTPSAQLHTTGSLRFENLSQQNTQSRVLVTDNAGNVYWRDAATFGTANAWLTGGNTGTDPAINFLGTIDNRDLVVRTNNQPQIRVLASNGNVGIGTASPLVRLHVSDASGAMLFPYEAAVVERGGDTKFTVASSDPAGAGGSSIVLCHSNFMVNGTNRGYEMQYAINNGRWLRFNAVERDAGGFITGGAANIMILTDNSSVGVNLGPTGGGGTPNQPTANFHTNGTVRHENLPAGAGTALVIDQNGNVFRSSGAKEGASNEELMEEIRQLKKEITELRSIISPDKGNKSTGTKESARISRIEPNPLDQQTRIHYYVPETGNRAVIQVMDMNGNNLYESPVLVRGNGSIRWNAAGQSSGAYVCVLVTGGKVVDSRKILVAH